MYLWKSIPEPAWLEDTSGKDELHRGDSIEAVVA